MYSANAMNPWSPTWKLATKYKPHDSKALLEDATHICKVFFDMWFLLRKTYRGCVLFFNSYAEALSTVARIASWLVEFSVNCQDKITHPLSLDTWVGIYQKLEISQKMMMKKWKSECADFCEQTPDDFHTWERTYTELRRKRQVILLGVGKLDVGNNKFLDAMRKEIVDEANNLLNDIDNARQQKYKSQITQTEGGK